MRVYYAIGSLMFLALAGLGNHPGSPQPDSQATNFELPFSVKSSIYIYEGKTSYPFAASIRENFVKSDMLENSVQQLAIEEQNSGRCAEQIRNIF